MKRLLEEFETYYQNPARQEELTAEEYKAEVKKAIQEFYKFIYDCHNPEIEKELLIAYLNKEHYDFFS